MITNDTIVVLSVVPWALAMIFAMASGVLDGMFKDDDEE